mgnify:CR=1 FL=1
MSKAQMTKRLALKKIIADVNANDAVESIDRIVTPDIPKENLGGDARSLADFHLPVQVVE